MSDTPFTDSCTYGFTDEDGIHCEAVHADIARTLERELDRYKSEVEVITRERDEAREALREIAAADWKTSGELRGMARRVLEAAK